jgi:hypothetical protein
MATIGFKERAKRHQIKFREDVLKVSYEGDYETILKDEDAQRGLIFFDGFKINEYAQQRYPHFKLKQACFANMLRSEHVPFNFFVPLSKNLEYARAVLNRFIGGVINVITEIRIEHAPDPAKTLLDKTSFDVFIEYRHADGGYGILGIEVKYTERAYKLIPKSKEERDINDPKSRYYEVMEKIGLYRKEIWHELKTDEFRQIWRNQLLGESMTRKNHADSKYERFTSIILYPESNEHFRKLIPLYKDFLTTGNEKSFIGITYEEFIDSAVKLTEDSEFLRWLQYLSDRYIVKNG